MQIQVCNHSSYPAGDAPLASLDAQVELGLDWVTVCPRGAGDWVTGLAASLDGARLGEPISPAFHPAPTRTLRVQARLRNRVDLAHPAHTAEHDEPTDDAGSVSPRAACENARRRSTLPVKLSLTGPYTLSRLAQLETTAYRDLDHLAEDLANHLADLVRDAATAGARFVQVDEPALLLAPEDVRLVRELLEPLQDAVESRAELSVATYGAPVGNLFAQLNSLPGSVVALDCVAGPAIIDDLAATGSGKPLALGLVDGGAGVDAAILASRVEAAIRRYAHDTLYLQPSRGLDAVTPSSARAALSTLLAVRDLLLGTVPD